MISNRALQQQGTVKHAMKLLADLTNGKEVGGLWRTPSPGKHIITRKCLQHQVFAYAHPYPPWVGPILSCQASTKQSACEERTQIPHMHLQISNFVTGPTFLIRKRLSDSASDHEKRQLLSVALSQM